MKELQSGKTKSGKKKKRKALKVVIIILVILGVIGIGISSCVNRVSKVLKEMTKDVTAQAYGTHDTSIISEVNGVVHSKNVQTVSQQGGKITTLMVEKGDRVKKGDLLVAFDSSDIDSQIKNLEAQMSDSDKQQAKQVEIARHNLESAKISANAEVKQAAKELEAARNEYNEMNDMLTKAQERREEALRDYEDAFAELAELRGQLLAAEKAYTEEPILDAETEEMLPFNTAKTEEGSEQEVDESTAGNGSENESAVDIDALKKQIEEKEKQVDILKQAYEASDKVLSDGSLETSVKSAKKGLDTAQNMYDKTVLTSDSSVQGQRDQLELQELSSNSHSDAASQLAKLYEQKAACMVKAEFDGIVTVLNGSEGELVSGVVLQVEDDKNLQIKLSVKEKDMVRLKEGAEVQISATNIEGVEASGKVTVVHRFNAENTSSAGGEMLGASDGNTQSTTYEVIAEVTEGAENLFLDMNVKTRIVIEKGEAVYAVPYTSIVTPDDNTSSYVFVATPSGDANGQTVGLGGGAMYMISKVEVKPGKEGEYYTEIEASKLEPGDLVITTATDVYDGEGVMVTVISPKED